MRALVAVVVVVLMSPLAHAAASPVPSPGLTPNSPVAPQPRVAPAPILPTPPEFDPGFYKPPQAIVAAKRPGEIIAAQRVNLAYNSVWPVNVQAWKISYRTNNSRGEPITGVATVMRPARSGNAKALLSYQIAEDSGGQYCRPSYLMQFGSPGLLAGSAETTQFFFVPLAALELGWTVVTPDAQGPNQAFGAGPLEGRVTLDGIRAAKSFAPLHVTSTTPIGMMGYSGGALATGHAAELHKDYAPDLNIVGTAEGGIPADVKEALAMSSGNAGSGIIDAGIVGASREYPELRKFLDDYLTPPAKALFAAKGQLCQVFTASAVPFLPNDSLFTIPDALDNPRVAHIFDQLRMGNRTPDMPMFMIHANPDWLLPVGAVNKLYGTYCRTGGRVQYVRDNFSEHLTLDVFSVPLMVKFLKDRFEGKAAAPGCALNDVGTVLAAPQLWSTLVPEIAPVVQTLFGKPAGA